MMCRKQVLSEQNALALQRYNKVGKRNKEVHKMVDSIAVLDLSVPDIQHIHWWVVVNTTEYTCLLKRISAFDKEWTEWASER